MILFVQDVVLLNANLAVSYLLQITLKDNLHYK